MSVLKNIAAIAKGMSITFMEMFQPTQVENYPDGPGPLRGARFQERFRGMHVLQRDENGLEKCVACFLCAAACPSNCIYIEAAENTETNRVSGAERYAKVYNIDYNRCIFCGYCVEACPTDAITHGHGFELASFNASNLIYRKEQMLSAAPAHMGANAVFNSADVAVITKNDLATAVEFDWEAARKSIESVRPGMQIFRLSAKTGEGLQPYLEFLAQRLSDQRSVVHI